jgi:serine/threonine-protein kinase
LAGKYRVERIIGQGGMGVVVEARHIALDDRVALKFLLAEYATHPEASQRFLREAQAARKIKSEHIARVTDVGTLENGAPYMVMEFLEGKDLSKYLETQGVLTIEDAIDYVIQGCDALAEAHSLGIIHRDIKPANLFLSTRPNGMPLVKVLDFGISKVMGGTVDSLTKTTASMGSALYMSPEQMQATRNVDQRTDVYALGISLYELLAGRQPFYADTLPQLCAEIFTGTPSPIRTIRNDVPEGLAIVLERAYARDRLHRYQSVGEFVVALAPWAPIRSQNVIESIAKLTGLPVPQAGAAGPPPVPGPGAYPPPGGTAFMDGYQPAPGAFNPSSGMQVNPGSGMHVLGGLPRTTGTGVSVAAAPPQSSSKGPLVAVALVAVLGLGGGAVWFSKRATPAPPPVAAADTGSPAPAAAPTETAKPAPAAPTASAVATATAAAPTPSSSAAVAATPPATGPVAAATPVHAGPAKGPGKPPPAAPPAAPPTGPKKAGTPDPGF